MAERLVEMYPVHADVEILLDEQWVGGRVVRHDFPAVWVQTPPGYLWFVTNGRRIRRRSGEVGERQSGGEGEG